MEQQFKQHLKKVASYNEAIALMYWDMRTKAPKKSAESRSESVGVLSGEVFRMMTSNEYGEMIAALEAKIDELDPVTKRSVEEARKQFDRSRKVPAEAYERFVTLQSKAETVWEQAKDQQDFALFQPYLEKLVEGTKEMIGYWGEKNGSAYNTLLDQDEPGITTAVLDEVFGQLRNRIVPLVQKIQQAGDKPDTSFLYGKFPKQAQYEFSLKLMEQLGYDFDAGRLDETVHPFMIQINRNDQRITNNYDENDFRTAVFGTIHETGHAIYEQNFGEELADSMVDGASSMGIHESQSLFFENFIGRNPSFWEKNLQELQQFSPGQFDDVTVEQFYRAINESKPSLIRIEADELTYTLHIMIRYELEKALFNGDAEVKDLPQLWNDKYEEYLGVRPSHDGEGVLQDVHWAGGSFGYFPSYALGYIYAAQFRQAMKKDLPDFDELLAAGNVAPIREWLTDNVHRHGAMKKPLEIMQDATGEGLNANHLADYLEDKYSRIYSL
ncbi:carboxypeptidase M32 [Planomicrobium sp. YIM 101495]|uniref:carboxypeptidase M32 n=1 Tax=Planomicrobium sp. YIM 101495 TaxID=2665160 RepID=UPI0012B84451|nr:carboxypeptidase M32 [Planomicrobium sp. YIM 101495]MTD30023.1 carboxypeptidase M32 [Planomicrobium sp. YIM 101495]